MANFMPNRTNSEKLNTLPKEDGNFIIVKDNRSLYADLNIGTEENPDIQRIRLDSEMEETIDNALDFVYPVRTTGKFAVASSNEIKDATADGSDIQVFYNGIWITGDSANGWFYDWSQPVVDSQDGESCIKLAINGNGDFLGQFSSKMFNQDHINISNYKYLKFDIKAPSTKFVTQGKVGLSSNEDSVNWPGYTTGARYRRWNLNVANYTAETWITISLDLDKSNSSTGGYNSSQVRTITFDGAIRDTDSKNGSIYIKNIRFTNNEDELVLKDVEIKQNFEDNEIIKQTNQEGIAIFNSNTSEMLFNVGENPGTIQVKYRQNINILLRDLSWEIKQLKSQIVALENAIANS